jgi:curved DNA-binding protein CbpA
MAGRVRYDPRIDYYAALDLTLSASADQIQSAFRQRAKQLHPDRNPDAEATRQFQKLSEAYAILSDPAIRAEYDEARVAINLRAAFQSLKRERTKSTGGSGGFYWRRVLRGLARSPYRYVFLLLALVALANIGFVLWTGSFNVDSTALATAQSATSSAVIDGLPLPSTAQSEPVNPACDPGAQMSSPRNGETISGAFEVKASITSDFQLDWAPVSDSAGRLQVPNWQILSSGKGNATPTDSLASLALTAAAVTIARPARIFLRLTVGSPTDSQPIQVCEIVVTLVA